MSNLWTGEFSRGAESFGSFALPKAMPMFTPWHNGNGARGEGGVENSDVEADAFAQGFDEGRRTVELELAADREALARLTESLEALRPEPTGALAAMLAETVERLVRQIVGSVEIDGKLLRERAETVAAMIGEDTDPARLLVHPEDAPLLGDARVPVEIATDPALPRGTVRLESGAGWIEDGPVVRLERLRRALDQMGAGL